jgi:hypothetical protein
MSRTILNRLILAAIVVSFVAAIELWAHELPVKTFCELDCWQEAR